MSDAPEGLAALVDEVGDTLELNVEIGEGADEKTVEAILRRLLDGETIPGGELAEANVAFTERTEAPLDDRPGAEPGEAEPSDEEIEDFEPEPPFVGTQLFQFGPLAAGIQIAEALLAEAKAGYITQRISELEAVLRTRFDEEAKVQIATDASTYQDELKLPDVSGGYQRVMAERNPG